MSQKDLQFIERALAHPWMFWVYFWKWPRIVRQACAEYDLLAKERDAAKAAHERSERANKIVRDWIHVTHRLSTTPEAIRAIFAAGKRLSILLVFFVVTNTYGQAPPYLRNQWTTNANPLALKVISTNGIRVATNIWELDFTNTATVTVSAVSNANKVMVSFTGSASSGSSSLTNALLHAGPTNGSVGALILTAGNGVTLTTSGTNRVLAVSNNIITGSGFWTNFSAVDSEGGALYGIRNSDSPYTSVASIAANYLTNFYGEPASVIVLGASAGSTNLGTASLATFIAGDHAAENISWTEAYDIYLIGGQAGQNLTLHESDTIFGIGVRALRLTEITNSSNLFFFGETAGRDATIIDSGNIVGIGSASLQQLISKSSTSLQGYGEQALGGAQVTDSRYIVGGGNYQALGNALITNSEAIEAHGYQAMQDSVTRDSQYIYAIDYWALRDSIIHNSDVTLAVGYHCFRNARLTNDSLVHAFGAYAGSNSILNDSSIFFDYGYGAAQKQISFNSTSIYSYGTFSSSNQVVNGTSRYYTYGAYSGAASQVTNSTDIYGFGTYSFRDAHINDSTNLFGSGIDTFEHALLTNSHNITAIGFETLENAKLTNSIDIIAIGNRVGLSGSGLEDIIILGNDVSSALSHQVVLGAADQTNLIQGSLQVTSGTLGAGKVLTDVNGDGFATWQNPTGSGGGIASIFTNNVLAGGPGLTELGFTNSATVLVAATTNAGRVTVSFESTVGAPGIATNSGTGWDTTFRSVSTNTVPLRIETEAGLNLTNFFQVATNGGTQPFFVISSNKFVGIGTNAPSTPLHIRPETASGTGYLRIDEPDGTHRVRIGTATGLSGFGAIWLGTATPILNSATLISDGTDVYVQSASAGSIWFRAAGSDRWRVAASTGHFLAGLDNTYDIGAGGATRPRNVYIAGATTIGGGITNDALTASKLVRTDATKKLVSSTLDESDIAAKQAGSAVLTNLSTTRAVTNMTVTTITNVGVSLYTVPSGCAYIFVECIGGGGGGGGVDGATSQSAAGGGGGSGAYCATNIATPAASYIVTVGTNGLGGAAGNNNGTIGGTTTFTNILTALGGSGGQGDASAAGVGFAVGGAGALQTATGRVYTGGNPGHNGICVSSALAVSGGGAGSHFGGGGAPQTADVGQNATGKGAGGSGAAVITNADRAGGNGSPGIIVIREFYQ